MIKVTKYILGYLVVVFLLNALYVKEYGNLFFLLLTTCGLFFNLLVIFKTNILSKEYKFLSAGFIGVTTAFLIFNGGVVTLMYIKNFNFIDANRFLYFLDNEMLMKFTTAAALGNVFLWIGYGVKLGDYLFSFYYLGLGYKKLLDLDIKVSFPQTLIVIGLSLNAVLFSYGAYGRGTASPEDFSGLIKYLIIFSSYIEKLSIVGYFLLALIHFKTGLYKRWFWGTLVLLVIFALLSGARGPIMFLYILTILPYYYVYKKFTKGLFLIGLATMLVAFTLAYEIKRFTQSFNTSEISITDYADEFIDYREESGDEFNRKIYSTLYYSILVRINTVGSGSIAMKYKDEHGLDKTDPNFVQEYFMAPVYAFIPRSKVLNSAFPSWGNWFRVKVLQFSDSYMSNTTFGAVAFFYMTGKWFFVAFGFFVYGVCLRFSNNILELGSGISFLVYLVILSALGYVSASVPGSLVSFIRYIVFLPIFFFVVIRFFNSLRL